MIPMRLRVSKEVPPSERLSSRCLGDGVITNDDYAFDIAQIPVSASLSCGGTARAKASILNRPTWSATSTHS